MSLKRKWRKEGYQTWSKEVRKEGRKGGKEYNNYNYNNITIIIWNCTIHKELFPFYCWIVSSYVCIIFCVFNHLHIFGLLPCFNSCDNNRNGHSYISTVFKNNYCVCILQWNWWFPYYSMCKFFGNLPNIFLYTFTFLPGKWGYLFLNIFANTCLFCFYHRHATRHEWHFIDFYLYFPKG